MEMRHIGKSFSGVTVLDDVDFSLKKGEIHALVGQNGAGKSTLMKILNGVYSKDSGEIYIDGKKTEYSDPIGARQAGVSMVFQEFSLVPTLTVSQNVFLSNADDFKKWGFLDDEAMERRTEDLLEEIGVDVDIDPKEEVSRLSVGSRQLVEIAKALSLNARILVLDEPTASLSQSEIESLFEVIRRLKKRDISIIYISHYLRDLFKICDRVTVLRDGKKQYTKLMTETDMEEVIGAMVGKQIEAHRDWTRFTIDRTQKPLLHVENVTTKYVKNISFDIWPKEIVGLAGLLGSGRTEIMRAIFGIDDVTGGTIKIEGKEAKITSSKDAIREGLSLIPEDRRSQGLILDFTIKDNILLPILKRLKKVLFLDDQKGEKIVQSYINDLNIKSEGMLQLAQFLSGGNQQKIVVAKNMATNSKILLLDDPTFGIDVKSKLEIMNIVKDFVGAGNGALIISSELGEIASFCDRVLIVRRGEVVDTLENNEESNLTEDYLLKLVQ